MPGQVLATGAGTEMLDRLEDLLRRARTGGAVEADAFMVEEELQTVQVRLGTVESLKHARENRCSLRIFTESGSASATTSDLSPGALARLVDESVRLAQVTRRDEHSGLPSSEALARDIPDLQLWDPEGHAMGGRGEDRLGSPGRGGGPRERRARAELRGGRVLRPPGPGGLRLDRRIRRGLPGLVVRPVGDAGCLRRRRHGARLLVHVGPSSRRPRAPGGDRAGGGAPGGAPARRPQGPHDGGAGRLRPGDGGEPDPGCGGGRVRPEPLPRHVVPGRPAGEDGRVAPGDDRRRSPDAPGARIPAIRRRGPAEPEDGAGGSRRPVELSPRHLQRPAARPHGDRARRPRGRGRRDGGLHQSLPRARVLDARGDHRGPSTGGST